MFNYRNIRLFKPKCEGRTCMYLAFTILVDFTITNKITRLTNVIFAGAGYSGYSDSSIT